MTNIGIGFGNYLSDCTGQDAINKTKILSVRWLDDCITINRTNNFSCKVTHVLLYICCKEKNFSSILKSHFLS